MDTESSEPGTPASPQRPHSSRHGSSKHVHAGHGPGHKHSKPWTARLYRKHDAKHYREPEAAPLLTEESQDEAEPDHEHSRGCRGVTSQYLGVVGGLIVGAGSAVGKAIAEGGKAVADSASKASRAVRDNPKRMMGALIVLLTAALTTVSIIHMIDQMQPNEEQPDLCTSPACIKAANYIFDNLDPSLINQGNAAAFDFRTSAIDPCTDFDKFVCGGFVKKHELREDQGDLSTGTLLKEKSEEVFKHIVNQAESKVSGEDVELLGTLKQAYSACMESTMSGLKPLKDVIETVKDLLPTTSPSKGDARRSLQSTLGIAQSMKDLHKVLVFVKQLGVDTLIRFEVVADPAKPDQDTVHILPPLAIGLPAPDFYRDAALVHEYRGLTTQMLKIFYEIHVNTSSILRRHQNLHATVLDLAQAVVDTEVKLALALPMRHDLVDPELTYHKVPLAELGKIIPQIDVEKVIGSLAPASYKSDTVVVASPEYLERLAFILNGTPVEVVQAFMSWKVIQQLSDLVDDPRLEPLKQFKAKVKGAVQEQPTEPWRYCVREVNDMLGWSVARFFVERKYDGDKASISSLVADEVKAALGAMLNDIDWMADDDKEAARSKLADVKAKIGFPKHPNVEDPSSVQEYYAELNITDSHFDNKVAAAGFQLDKIWHKLDKSSNDQWQVHPTAIKAYYDLFANQVIFPAGLLQAPFVFGKSVPHYMGFGAFGSVAGRKIAHSVGRIGSHFDTDGKLIGGWTNETYDQFKPKAQCFIDQYKKFAIKGPKKTHHVDGQLTLAENIADAAGVRAAFRAWKDAEDASPAKLLPGLEKFTKEQLFWMAYGSSLCSKTSPEKAAQRVLTDNHAPKPARILGTVANSKSFLEAFECSVKEPACELF